MCSDGVDFWTVKEPKREVVLRKIVWAIRRWDLNTERNINYRSFQPIFGLLKVTHTEECQYWAVWALANLTTVYRKFRYKVNHQSATKLFFCTYFQLLTGFFFFRRKILSIGNER